MYITVRLLNNFSKKLTYSVPDTLQQGIFVGTLVQVPLQRRIESAIVLSIDLQETIYPFALRAIDSIYPLPLDLNYIRFITQLSRFHHINVLYLYQRIKNFLTEKQDDEVIPTQQDQGALDSIVLTDEQLHAVEEISQDLYNQKYQATLLYGVTGSGKTEVYKKLCQLAISQGKSVILLLPEVSLAARFELLLKQQLPEIEVFGFHSGTTIKYKRLLWQALLQEKAIIIIGVHLPVFLPIANLGMIIVDEEHDSGYQEKNHPKFHSRNVALLKAMLANVPIVLGSATPSIASLWNVEHKQWRLIEMKNRFAGHFPSVQVVCLSDKKERKNFWISSELFTAMKSQLIKKEQTIIFINRRGYSFFIQCVVCTFIFSCTNCSVSLTLHEDGRLLCHYCNFIMTKYDTCPDCHGSEFLKKGVGTQQVVSILQKLFPSAVIARADLDTTCKKKLWQQTVQDFYDKKIDILVGTQSITKGYHFPHVTLVGILWADVNLHFPIYNAAETTLQQLIQVAGRAGRQSAESKVIVQTMTPHSLFNYICEQDYHKFYVHEIVKRQEIGYPPVKHIAEIEIRNQMQTVVEREAQAIAEILIATAPENVLILGPVPAVVYRVQKTYSQKIFLKSIDRADMIKLFSMIRQENFSSTLYFTIDPVA